MTRRACPPSLPWCSAPVARRVAVAGQCGKTRSSSGFVSVETPGPCLLNKRRHFLSAGQSRPLTGRAGRDLCRCGTIFVARSLNIHLRFSHRSWIVSINRRHLLAVSALTGAVPAATLAAPAGAAPLSTFGVDAMQLGVRAGGGADQSNMLQAAVDKAAGARMPLLLGPGDYHVRGLTLPSSAQIVGVRGATRLIFIGGAALLTARGASSVTLAGLVLDGG